MIIRDATKKDLPQCEKLIKIPEFEFCEGGFPDIPFLSNYLEKDFFLIAEEDNKILGCVIGEKLKSKVIMIWYLVVDSSIRGKGIGNQLMNEFEKRAKQNGFEWSLLQAPLESSKTLEFYQKNGYNKGKSFIEYNKAL